MVDRTTAVDAGLAAGLRPLGGAHPLPGGQRMPDDHPALAVLTANSRRGDRPAARTIGPAPFACDGFIFNLHSPTPVVVLGPRGANAHAPDEWVDIEDLVTLTKTYALTIAEWLG